MVLDSKLKNKKMIAIIVCLNLTVLMILAVNVSIFYYKYTNVVKKTNSDYIERASFLLNVYVEKFDQLDRNQVKFQEFLSKGSLGDVYLLKYSPKGKLDLVASSRYDDINNLVLDEDCKDILHHDFKDKFYTKEVLPENRVKVCYFQNSGEYVVGYKHIFTHTLFGTGDPDFGIWLNKNLMPTFITATLVGILFIVISILVLNRYFDLRLEFLNSKIVLKKDLREIKDQLYVDPVTKLSNKRALMEDLKGFEKPKIVIVDIDDFGVMNDYYGREICDKILVYIANLVKDFAKNENMKTYCMGADQFALVENGDFSMERYETLSEELSGRFKGRMISIKDNDNDKTIEIEVHTTIGFSLDSEDTLIKASTALKTAKKLQKDFVCYYKGLNQKDEYSKQIERSNIIRQAIINSSIVPFFQPIFDSSGNITKYESLVRIIDSDEIVSPHVFLTISKRIKRYAELQKMVISSCFKQLCDNENLILSINLSGRDMIDGDVSSHIQDLLNKHDVADRLVFELVEDENLENVERIETFIEKVKKMGVKIAIDDFGSGYSNFSYILKLRPDYIKIDGSIIKNIDTNQDSYMITRAIVSFARDLGIKTIAEYIHSKDIFALCKALGVDEFQGFYLGVPTDKVF